MKQFTTLHQRIGKAFASLILYVVERSNEALSHFPDDVVRDKISSMVEDGILTITMTKTEPKEKDTEAIEVS